MVHLLVTSAKSDIWNAVWILKRLLVLEQWCSQENAGWQHRMTLRNRTKTNIHFKRITRFHCHVRIGENSDVSFLKRFHWEGCDVHRQGTLDRHKCNRGKHTNCDLSDATSDLPGRSSKKLWTQADTGYSPPRNVWNAWRRMKPWEISQFTSSFQSFSKTLKEDRFSQSRNWEDKLHKLLLLQNLLSLCSVFTICHNLLSWLETHWVHSEGEVRPFDHAHLTASFQGVSLKVPWVLWLGKNVLKDVPFELSCCTKIFTTEATFQRFWPHRAPHSPRSPPTLIHKSLEENDNKALTKPSNFSPTPSLLDLHSFNIFQLSISLHSFASSQNFIPLPKLCDANATKSRNATLFVARTRPGRIYPSRRVGGWDRPPNKGAATSRQLHPLLTLVSNTSSPREGNDETTMNNREVQSGQLEPIHVPNSAGFSFLDVSHFCPFFLENFLIQKMSDEIKWHLH